MGPIAWALAIGAVWAGWKLFQSATHRFVGDYAKTGDEVLVHPQFLASPPTTLPSGTLWVAIKVLGGDKERVQGPIVGWQQPGTQNTMRIPAAVGSFVVQRNTIFRVIRDGKTIATNG
jgi:hypothetical protein